MHFNTGFKGRLIQIIEALSHDDAVSNQVIEMDRIFRQMGLNSAIHCKWHDSRMAASCHPLEALTLSEHDVVVYHYSGYAEHTWPFVYASYCTRVLVYHNITPHEFFPAASPQHQFCHRGYVQLETGLGHFHAYWAASQFNLDELTRLGATASKCLVLPIAVAAAGAGPPAALPRAPGSWLFVAGVASNNGQVALLQMFSRLRRDRPELAQSLHIVVAYGADDPYYRELAALVELMGLREVVHLHGKILQTQRDLLFSTSCIYVSLGGHEGFDVPTIEAALHGLPVVALAAVAVPEPLGGSRGLAADVAALERLVVEVLSNPDFRSGLVDEQARNARRFSPAAVERRLHEGLRTLLPSTRQFRTVSIVICTYNRREFLERVLDYLQYQSSPAFEVVIIDGPSDDGTKKFLEGFAGVVKIAHNPQRNLSVSRNLGIELADGDVVAFIDDDALPFDNWIEHVLAEYNRRPLTTAGLGGPAYYAGTFQFQAEDNGVNGRGEAWRNIESRQIGNDGWWRYNTGTNATFSTAAIRAVNGFDEQFDYYLDESELCLRLQLKGCLIGYAPDVVVRHEFAQSHNRQGRMNYNWFAICKNTAYFASAYGGMAASELQEYLRTRMNVERIAPMDELVAAGTMDPAERERHAQAIGSGVERGLADARDFFPRTRALAPAPATFKPFPTHYDAPRLPGGRKRLHICIVSKELPPFAAGGGVGTLYYHLASELLLMGHRISAVVQGAEGQVFEQGNMRAHYTALQDKPVKGLDGAFSRNLGWSLSAMKKVSEIHARDPIDVVDSALWDTEALALSLLPSQSRPPLVVRLVTPFALASRIDNWGVAPATAAQFIEAEKALMANADALVPISESIASFIEKEYDISRDARWQLVNCGIAYWPFFDVSQGYDEFPSLQGIGQEVLEASKLVVFIGRLEMRKGIDLVLAAANGILDADPRARLIVAGRDVESWMKRAGSMVREDLLNRVHILGEVSDATRDKLLAKAYCLLFPSRYESFGLVPLEAFVHGVPVVAAKAGAIPEVVEHGVSGLLFDMDDSEALAETTCRLLRDTELHARLAQGALRRVRYMSSRRSAVATQRLYEALLCG